MLACGGARGIVSVDLTLMTFNMLMPGVILSSTTVCAFKEA